MTVHDRTRLIGRVTKNEVWDSYFVFLYPFNQVRAAKKKCDRGERIFEPRGKTVGKKRGGKGRWRNVNINEHQRELREYREETVAQKKTGRAWNLHKHLVCSRNFRKNIQKTIPRSICVVFSYYTIGLAKSQELDGWKWMLFLEKTSFFFWNFIEFG